MKRTRPTADMARFAGVRLPSSDFNAVNDGLAIPYQFIELDLTAARSIAAGTAPELLIAGNSIYVDRNTDVGVATLVLQGPNRNAPPGRIYVEPGANFRIPFTRCIVENLAQPGKFLRLFYGVDINFQPGTTGTVVIGGVTQVSEQGTAAGASFSSTTALVANTPQFLISTAANLNGAVIWSAHSDERDNVGAVLAQGGMTSGSSTPAAITTGALLFGVRPVLVAGALATVEGELPRIMRIASGQNAVWIVNATMTGGFRGARYTLL